MTLPRSARMPDARAFAEAFASRRVIAEPYFRVHVGRPDTAIESAHPRLGVAVSRRISGKAVERNRIKRQIRESFRLSRAGLPALDLVVVARSAAAAATNQQLREALESLWRRLKTE